ncbi:MAG: hypothetical protein DCF19_15455 [Pseudanabaena frigida]|uniref:Uncharacterized protein n=1 Tax=Pseudanabaena frigida TaxID=945775 RepID=A0A2W4Y6K5_9CYAN|nr:MAG: hypothetical protein DCF19_15455 [Pseudanabaena frigida]
MSLTDNVGLLDRLARLERENATLKVELEKCQERANQERVAEIEKRDRLLEATVMPTNAQ